MKLTRHDLPKFKSPSSFVLVNTQERDGKCGHYGELDKNSYCMDDDCRRDRLVKALIDGKARMLSDGYTLVWDVE